MKINNRKAVIINCLIWLIPVLLFMIVSYFSLYFGLKKYKQIFFLISIISGIILAFKIWNEKYLDIHISSNQLIIKQFYAFRNSKSPVKFMDVPVWYLTDFNINSPKKQLIFKIKSRTKNSEVWFSSRYLHNKEIVKMEKKLMNFMMHYKNIEMT